MSDDPETLRQIEELAAMTGRCWCSTSTTSCLNSSAPSRISSSRAAIGLTLASFRLTGNIAETASGRLIEQPEVTTLLGDFFDAQADWQSITDGAAEALARLGDRAEIIC